MTPFDVYEALRAQIERVTGIKAVLEPSSIKEDRPVVRISPLKFSFRRETQGDEEDGPVVFGASCLLTARVEGTGLGFKNTVAASLALLRFFEVEDEALQDADGEEIVDATFSGKSMGDQAKLVPSEEHERMYEYEDAFSVEITIPRALL